jgi:hypothetical protein
MSAFTTEQLSLTQLNLSERMEQVIWIQKFIKSVRESADRRKESAERKEEWLHLTKRLEDLDAFFDSRYKQHERTLAITEKALKAKEEEAAAPPPVDSFQPLKE